MSGEQATQILPPPLTPGTRFGPYRILGLIGEGGMGQVYQAVQGMLERTVALKVMRPELAKDPQFAERFLREARAAASICHQSVVVIFDAGEQDGQLFMAFQFVPGGDLDAELGRRKRYEVVPALDLIASCCEGLQSIHEAGLVHRDIKPHNIFLDAQGRPKLGDFGLARQAQGSDRMTLTGVGMGTPSYMSPEQAQGLADIDIRADIHALGGTLYTLLTGQVPYSGLTPWMVVNAVCNEPAPDPRAVQPDIPEAVAAIVLRCLAMQRDQRYATPLTLRQDLLQVRAALAGESVGLMTTSLPRVPTRDLHPWLAWGWRWSAGSAVALLLLPWVLRPLLEANDRYRFDAWSPAWWAGWLSAVTCQAVLMWAILSPSPMSRRNLVVPWLAAATVAGLSCGLAGNAVSAALTLQDSAWSTLLSAFAWGVGISGAAVLAQRWWKADQTLVTWAMPRTLALSASCLLITVICHLAIADRPQTSSVKEESRSLGASIRSIFNGTERQTPSSNNRAIGAATALAWLTPITILFIVPTWLVRRKSRTETA
jgi:serine/threonine protein kinase